MHERDATRRAATAAERNIGNIGRVHLHIQYQRDLLLMIRLISLMSDNNSTPLYLTTKYFISLRKSAFRFNVLDKELENANNSLLEPIVNEQTVDYLLNVCETLYDCGICCHKVYYRHTKIYKFRLSICFLLGELPVVY